MDNFEKKQRGVHTQLTQINEIIKHIEPSFYAHLKKNNANSLFFCFRWLIILFKREFSMPDVMFIWEVIWCQFYSSHHHLFICLAMLLSFKEEIIKNDMNFDDMLQVL